MHGLSPNNSNSHFSDRNRVYDPGGDDHNYKFVGGPTHEDGDSTEGNGDNKFVHDPGGEDLINIKGTSMRDNDNSTTSCRDSDN
jgi:hypothetical protein